MASCVTPTDHVMEDSDLVSTAKANLSMRKLPTRTWKMTGGVTEMHKSPIYCVAWSTDFHRKYDEMEKSIEAVTAEKPSDKATSMGRNNGNRNKKDEKLDAGDSSNMESATESSSHYQASANPSTLVRCLATCGGNHLTVYEVDVPEAGSSSASSGGDGFTLRQAYIDPDEKEVYYACAFGGRCLGRPFNYVPIIDDLQYDAAHPVVLTENSEEKDNRSKRPRRQLFQDMVDLASFDGPQLLCVAGSRGVIKVVDTVRKMLLLTLSGHGDEIYDMKFCPTKDWLLLSASKDESLRLWNVKTATCVAIFAGHEGHRDSILSLGWHPLGDRFASAGMDTSVKLWSIEEGTEVSKAIKSSGEVQPRIKDPSLGITDHKEAFRTIYEQMPYFSSNKIHTDYIDCVQFVGDLVLSKSINNAIVLWLPVLSKSARGGNKLSTQRLPNEVVALKEFTLNKCNVWFVRFQTDMDCQVLAIGNTSGEVKLWEIGSSPTRKHFAYLSHHKCNSTVRMVSFSPDGKCLVASCDDATLWKWDAA